MTASDARENFSELLQAVSRSDEPIVVERKRKAVAVVISPERFERYERQINQRFREAVDEIRRRNADKDPDAVLRDVTEIVEEVRRERYEREQRAP